MEEKERAAIERRHAALLQSYVEAIDRLLSARTTAITARDTKPEISVLRFLIGIVVMQTVILMILMRPLLNLKGF